MYAIKEGLAKINDVLVETFEREVTDGRTTLRVEAGTTGYKGAPCREAGGRTYVCIDCFCGDFYFSPVTDDENRVVGIEIAACGDDGLDAIMKALRFAQEALNDQRCEVND